MTWTSCESDVTGPEDAGDDSDSSDDGPDGESDAIHYFASIDNEDDIPTLRITGARWGEWHVFHDQPVSGPGGEPLDTSTVDGLRTLLERAGEQVRDAGYQTDGDWTLRWSRCHVLLAD
ncbi:hypothetical protein ACH4ZX_13055 [Streptomyces sp. NPDC020490]|uniref:hypothetical protein n=1 Tax=Streptomyces sp. NPDC020490 TaxID=3365078 RepID=UPI0037B460A7